MHEPWHYLHHAWAMMWELLDHELMLSVLWLWPFNHFLDNVLLCEFQSGFPIITADEWFASFGMASTILLFKSFFEQWIEWNMLTPAFWRLFGDGTGNESWNSDLSYSSYSSQIQMPSVYSKKWRFGIAIPIPVPHWHLGGDYIWFYAGKIRQACHVTNMYNNPVQNAYKIICGVSEITYIQAMWTVHGVVPQILTVSCCLIDNMAQGIHLKRKQQKVKSIKFLYQEYKKHNKHIWFALTTYQTLRSK